MWDCVNKKQPPPPELVIGMDWRVLGVPYASGGLKDQPLRLYKRMKLALMFYDALMAWKHRPTKPKQYSEWMKRNQDVLDIVKKASKYGE